MNLNSDQQLEENYYQFFSIEKNASPNEVNAAYRRMSKFYHPDKHDDPIRKEQAAQVFNKIKKIHEVLSDPQKRAIYDNLGEKGLDVAGWEVIEKYKTSDEIRQEYEKLNLLEEEKRQQLSANPRGNINITINATDLFSSYDPYANTYKEEFPTLKSNLIFDFIRSTFNAINSVELMSMSIHQSVDSQLTGMDNLHFAGSVNTKNGVGSGDVATVFRRIHSPDKWSEIETSFSNGVNLGFRHSRSLSQKLFMNAAINAKVFPNGILVPGFQLTLSQQLDTHLTGQLTWHAGFASSLAASFIRQTNELRFITTFQLGIPHSFISASISKQFYDSTLKLKTQIKFGTFGSMIEYGCEKRLNPNTVIGAYMMVGVPFGVNLTLKLNRANQNFSFVSLLCQDLLPAPIIIGTIAPLLSYAAVRYLIIDPYIARRDKKQLAQEKEFFAGKLLEKKREAKIAVDLLKESYARIKEVETSRLGLLITKALYGDLLTLADYHSYIIDQTLNGNSHTSKHIIDVTIPLQCLVHDSKLTLPQGSKIDIPGFYDVNYGEPKSLYIKYDYRTVSHEVFYQDEQPIKLPSVAHKVNAD